MSQVASLLKEMRIYEFSQITEKETEEQRDIILSNFREGNIKIVLSITIFNEGIDVKKAKNAIVISSTTNPREYIQRRGRVLRKEKGIRKIANIYDLLVIPSLKDELDDIEKNIINKELKRMSYFAKNAINFDKILGDRHIENLIRKTGFLGLYN